jgi:hypothetical protein
MDEVPSGLWRMVFDMLNMVGVSVKCATSRAICLYGSGRCWVTGDGFEWREGRR